MRLRHLITGLLAVTLAAGAADARPRGPRGSFEPPTGEQREKLLQKVHTLLVAELGSILELDTADTIKLAAKLEPFHDQRTALRLKMFESMRALYQARQSEEQVDGGALARSIAESRVRLAEIDRKELEAILAITPADKSAEVALFLVQFPKRVERMAWEMREKRGGRGGRWGAPSDD